MTHRLDSFARPGRLFSWLAGALPLVLAFLATPAQAVGNVVISQVYGGGGNSQATIRNDYIELYNRSNADVNISGWAVQYTSATGTGTWTVTAIPPNTPPLPAGSYFLIKQAVGAGGSVDILFDLAGSITMSATAGKVALTSSTTALTGTSPVTAAVVDLVGYGSNASVFEGAGPAPGLSNTTAAFRAGGGATDTDNNAADFSVSAPAPRFTGGDAVPGGGGGGGGGGSCAGAPGATVTPVYTIQGAGATSTLANQVVTTQGVVTKLISSGFFIQDLAGDGNPATSDGIFVFVNPASCQSAQVGNLVSVTGTVTEYAPGSGTAGTPLTELTTVTSVVLLGSGYTITPTVLTLPLAEGDSFERFEGMLVTLQGTMTVQQNYFQAQYGQITIGVGRHQTPTNAFRPSDPQRTALAALQARSRLLLDDSRSSTYPNPTPYLADNGLGRAGDLVSNLTGVIDFGLATATASGAGLYRLQPVSTPVFTSANPRSATPPPVGGNISVAGVNVLNYFTTFTNGATAFGQTGQTCVTGQSAANSCRGADNLAEYTRQRDKMVRKLAGLNADVVGLMEIQNNGNTAVQALVDALNAFVGAGTYATIALPAGAGATGTDAIRVAMIYKPARLATVGLPLSDTDPVNNRPTLAQTFMAPNGEKFSLVANHFKSKGCGGASGLDTDQGDGQGCFNATRLAQSQRLRTFVAQVQSNSGSNDVMIVGDLNAYAKEDPIFDLTSNGYIDQIGRFNTFGYSYVFDGAAGRLDHAIATPGMSARVTGAIEWHINADEALAFDYNLENKQPACGTCAPDPYLGTNPYRSSDHDPVLLGLNIYKIITGTSAGDVLVGSPGDDRITGGPGADRLTGGAGANLFVYTSVLDGGDTITDFKPDADKIVLTDLFRSIKRINLPSALASGFVTCQAARGGALISVDSDGSVGPLPPRSLALLQGQGCANVMNAQNFVF